ncbi:hypothetical protein SD70_10295 [Gordoniibacillus kamchatkensis]|uniref:Uncharacterized protein n=1 Tax=Gordoniibacillus kamchatkensis TaxID=1590651 RepID=A0ABR5AIW6_9BACL|nr:hypothetical protein [Paenibacillus sp. VKM B-2647]KIL40994.1 hypothetical protein SD70_10295 [Paenibacillus sp. VKM B-2647]
MGEICIAILLKLTSCDGCISGSLMKNVALSDQDKAVFYKYCASVAALSSGGPVYGLLRVPV